MHHTEFAIGVEFWCGGSRWRCTDVGTRVIVAISLEPHEVVGTKVAQLGNTKPATSLGMTNDPSWLKGPPYAVVETVFDEYDLKDCSIKQDEA